ncbi:MAG: hypothetical protein ACRDNF_13475, partial [Streptosporangiaceae bacterium]
MPRRIIPRTALAARLAAITVATVTAVAAVAAGTGAAYAATDTPLPAHVFAPYFETYNTSSGSLATLSQESGARYLSLAFLQTAQAGSCTAYWNGDTSEPISSASFGSDISAI